MDHRRFWKNKKPITYVIDRIKEHVRFIVDKITRATSIDAKYLLRGGYWSVWDHVIDVIFGLVLAMAFARLLPQETYGVYSFVLSWLGIFSLFALSGITQAIIRSIANGYEGELQHGIKIKLRWGAISSALALGFAVYYFVIGNVVFGWSFLLVAIFLPIEQALGIVPLFLVAKERFQNNTFLNLAIRGAGFVTMFFVVLFTRSVPLMLVAYFVPDILIKLAVLRLEITVYQKNRKTSPETKPFATHLTAMNILGGVASKLDSVLTFHYLGAVELAIYKFASLPIDKFGSLVQTFLALSRIRFAKRDYAEIYPTLAKKLLIFNLVVIACTVPVYFFLPWAFKLFFPQYLEALAFARVLLIPFLFFFPNVIISLWLAKAEVKKLYIIRVVYGVTRIIFYFILIPLYGLWGAVWGNVGATIIMNILVFVMFLKHRGGYNKTSLSEQQVLQSSESL